MGTARAGWVVPLLMACDASPPPVSWEAVETDPSNILIVVLDDVGVEQIGAYGVGEQPPPTPTIDRLAAEGVRFTRAWANPLCSPTRASILTGMEPRRFGLGEGIPFMGEGDGLPLSARTLPEMLLEGSPRDYRTGAFGKWHLSTVGHDGAHNPNLQGFDRFAGTVGNLDAVVAFDGEPMDYYDYERVVDGDVSRVTTYATTEVVDDVIAFIEAGEEPWLAYTAFHAPHRPFQLPPAALIAGTLPGGDATDAELYAAMLEAADTEIGRLLEHVSASTLVILLGDNGSPSAVAAVPYGDGRAKRSVSEGGVRVPLVIRSPLVAEPGSESDALVRTTDLFSTIAQVAGVSETEMSGVDGRSLVPFLRDAGSPSVHPVLYSDVFAPNGSGPYDLHRRSIRGERFKLVWKMKTGHELYDLGDDWAETADLLAEDTLSAAAAEAMVELERRMEALILD